MIGVAERLQDALEDQVTAGASGTLARIEAPRACIDWAGSTGPLAEGEERSLRPGDAFRIASISKSFTATVAVKLSREDKVALESPSATS